MARAFLCTVYEGTKTIFVMAHECLRLTSAPPSCSARRRGIVSSFSKNPAVRYLRDVSTASVSVEHKARADRA